MSKKNTISSNIETKPEIFANTFNHSEPRKRPTQSFTKENMIRKQSNDTINNTSNLMMTLSNKTQPINLEDVVIQEDKLWNILDNIRTNCNFNFTAEEYLEFSQITSVQDFSIRQEILPVGAYSKGLIMIATYVESIPEVGKQDGVTKLIFDLDKILY